MARCKGGSVSDLLASLQAYYGEALEVQKVSQVKWVLTYRGAEADLCRHRDHTGTYLRLTPTNTAGASMILRRVDPEKPWPVGLVKSCLHLFSRRYAAKKAGKD